MIDKVNTSMESMTKQETQKTPVGAKPAAKPNEKAGFAVMGHLKIFDPNTKEIKVETRA